MREKALPNRTAKQAAAQRLNEREVALFEAAVKGDAQAVRGLLTKGVAADVRDNRNGPNWDQTPLMYAAQHGHVSVVDVLLTAGADVSAKDCGFVETTHEDQPLHYAAIGGNLGVIKRLLAAGADVNALNSSGNTALNIAIERGHAETVRFLLRSGAKVNLDPTTKHFPPLCVAASAKQPDIFRELLKAGADVNAVNPLNQTPLNCAATTPEEDAIPMIEELLKAGAKIDNVIDRLGGTSLLHAVFQNSPKVVKLLVQAGANPNQVFKSQRGTLLDGAEKRVEANQRTFDDPSSAEWEKKGAREGLEKWQPMFNLLRDLGAKRQSELDVQSSQLVSKPSARSSPQPPSAPNTISPPLGIKDFLTAVYGTEPEFSLVAIKAPLGNVCHHFTELHKVKKWVRDIPLKQAKKDEEVDAKLIPVVKLKHGDWTILFRSIFFSNDELMSQVAAYAKELSTKLKTRAISFVGEGTFDVMGYELYENGKKLEEVEWDAGLDILSFESKLRDKPSDEAIGDNVADKLFRSEGIYIPACYVRSENETSWLAVEAASAGTIATADIIEP